MKYTFGTDFHVMKVNGDWSCQDLKKGKTTSRATWWGGEGANVSIKKITYGEVEATMKVIKEHFTLKWYVH